MNEVNYQRALSKDGDLDLQKEEELFQKNARDEDQLINPTIDPSSDHRWPIQVAT